ncbi:hypothetical protein N9K60_03045 [Candidatus Poseidoniales archaeon]|nr:hypothetical protein [Candidatus Poseidoniales archaeon]
MKVVSFESISEFAKKLHINEFTDIIHFHDETIDLLKDKIYNFDHRKNFLDASWKELIDFGNISMMLKDEKRTLWAFRKALMALRFEAADHGELNKREKLLIQYYIFTATFRFNKEDSYSVTKDFVEECMQIYRSANSVSQVSELEIKSLILRATIEKRDMDRTFEVGLSRIKGNSLDELRSTLLLEWIKNRLYVEQNQQKSSFQSTGELIQLLHSEVESDRMKEYCKFLVVKSCKTMQPVKRIYCPLPILNDEILNLDNINLELLTRHQRDEINEFRTKYP